MANITIKGDPRMSAAIAEGANAVALREAKAENEKLRAVNGVRAIADEKRWNKMRRKWERKYTVKPTGRAREAILLVWALSWMVVFECFKRLQAINREA